jgi:CDGSH-type Zn-finger protein
MGTCKCGFSTDEEKNCNGTHKIVKAVRDQIAKEIENIDVSDGKLNGLGMKVLALKVVKGQ